MAPSLTSPPDGVRAVLLDLDDTIFDYSLTCREAIRRVRRQTPFLARRTLEELWREYLSLLNGPSFVPAQAALGSQGLRRERWRMLAASCGAELTPAEVADLSRTYRRFYQSVRRAVPGAVELVRRLHRSVRVGIVTNNELAEQEGKLRFLGLEDAIDALVVSEEVGRSKPDPGIFEEALDRLGTPAARAVMVGDSWTNDVLGARAAGIRAVWFNRFGLPRPAGADVDELVTLRPARQAQQLLLGSQDETEPPNRGSPLRVGRPSAGR